MDRPTILTEALREQIEQALADGVPTVVAAQRANVSAKSVSRWLRSGQIVRRRPPDPLGLVPEGPAESPEATLDAEMERGLEPTRRIAEQLNNRVYSVDEVG